jgi:protoheme IX farnesyltransferase
VRLPAAVRVIHPAPAIAVVALSGALGAIVSAQAGIPIGERWWLALLAVAGSQVFTGATNDLVDRERDAMGRPEKPIPAGELSPNAAAWIASLGLGVQLAASSRLGLAPFLLGLVAVGSAAAYNLVLSRTPFSPIPYLVSFAILPLWIASGVGVPASRVAAAAALAAPFAAAAHLANTLRDFDADAAGGSRSLAQVIGRARAHRLAVGLAIGVGVGVVAGLAVGGQGGWPELVLAGIGVVAVAQGASSERRLWGGMLTAAVCWTAAWALSTG